jgi:hypothetical protein
MGRLLTTAALAVTSFLVLSSLGGSVVLGTTSVRALPSMLFPAAERAAQISPASIAGMGEKADPAIATAHQATAQFGMASQNRPQRHLILTNKRPGRVVPVPVRPKNVNLLEGYEKKDRFCVTMRIVLSISSSYRLDAKSSSGWARSFYAPPREIQTHVPAIGATILPDAFLPLRLIHSASPARIPVSKKLLGKKNGHDKG